ncbi:MAG: tetratricopeptide repeat protein [Elusimicrobiales bacterium]|nr:tetratricopeptide repeat protein [Elusimicrobiales bacterium]
MPDSTWVSDGSSKNTNPFQDWLIQNKKSLIATALIIIAAIIIVIMVIINLNKNRETAEKYYFLAQQYYYAKNFEQALANIEIIEKNYSNFVTYDFALFLKGDIYFSIGNYAKAIEVYKEALNKVRNKELIPFAIYSIAKSHQALRDYINAILKFNEFITTYPDHYLLPEVYLSLALSYENKGEKEAAKETFQKITVLFPNTTWNTIAQEALKKYQQKQSS